MINNQKKSCVVELNVKRESSNVSVGGFMNLECNSSPSIFTSIQIRFKKLVIFF